MNPIRIRCPKCHWEPDGRPHWRCSCGHYWDTFATGGRCPKCQKVWEGTQCPNVPGGCLQWSPHLDWYEHLDGVVQEIKEVVNEPMVVNDGYQNIVFNAVLKGDGAVLVFTSGDLDKGKFIEGFKKTFYKLDF